MIGSSLLLRRRVHHARRHSAEGDVQGLGDYASVEMPFRPAFSRSTRKNSFRWSASTVSSTSTTPSSAPARGCHRSCRGDQVVVAVVGRP